MPVQDWAQAVIDAVVIAGYVDKPDACSFDLQQVLTILHRQESYKRDPRWLKLAGRNHSLNMIDNKSLETISFTPDFCSSLNEKQPKSHDA
jgi:hypothetical protein